MLRGDETGVLLGDHVLRHAPADPLVATTIVSSHTAREARARPAAPGSPSTLTGFKWLVRAGDGLVYAYEEAIGHCVDPDAVRDKDGISAAVLVADLAATLRGAGPTPCWTCSTTTRSSSGCTRATRCRDGSTDLARDHRD